MILIGTIDFFVYSTILGRFKSFKTLCSRPNVFNWQDTLLNFRPIFRAIFKAHSNPERALIRPGIKHFKQSRHREMLAKRLK